jgi:hypothetical protein
VVEERRANENAEMQPRRSEIYLPICPAIALVGLYYFCREHSAAISHADSHCYLEPHYINRMGCICVVQIIFSVIAFPIDEHVRTSMRPIARTRLLLDTQYMVTGPCYIARISRLDLNR